ncbi:hypothetical protein [Aquabacterium sp.]|nr:hypothetical protein [Aquabacterium sp.]HSW05705.1 hypothetical protein [Aquabacterium sp.]
MVSSDLWGALLALIAILAPLWLAWLLLGWSERRKLPRPGPGEQRKP